MIDKWYISIDFTKNIIDFMKFIKRLMSRNSNIYVRKEYLDFNQLGTEERKETIEEILESIIFDIQYFDSQEDKIKIYNDILYELKSKNTILNLNIEEIKDLLKREDILEVKQVIEINIDLFEYKESAFTPERSVLNQGHNNSFKTFFSNGTLESFDEAFNWYKFDDLNILSEFLNNNLNYNLIISDDITNLNNFNFFISYIENINFVLAIKAKNNLCEQVLLNVFKEEFGRNNELILYNTNMEI